MEPRCPYITSEGIWGCVVGFCPTIAEEVASRTKGVGTYVFNRDVPPSIFEHGCRQRLTRWIPVVEGEY